MIHEFLTPVSAELRTYASELDEFSIGQNLRFDADFEENSMVIFGIKETRDQIQDPHLELDFDLVREQFYLLKKGNWHVPLYDLGDILPGESLEDTYFAFLKIQQELLKKKCVLIILGGTSSLAYWQYRAFDAITHQVNVSCIDNRFRLGNSDYDLSSNNYLSKIITTEPHQLFDYSHLGYQTYFVGQEELDLMDQLNFDVKRLGKLIDNMQEAEPELRFSDLVILNLEALQASDFKSSTQQSPNGFSSREICSLSRYAGINNKVQSFGVYNFKAKNILVDNILLAEILWYFIEGKNQAPMELDLNEREDIETFYVQLPEQDLIFYHDIDSQQWWMELSEAEATQRQIIPCSIRDYEDSLKGRIPDRWWKSFKKLY